MNKQSALNQILNSLSKDELVHIIEDAAEENAVLKNKLIFKYSKLDSGQELKQCKKLMKAIVKKYKGREGFIYYRDAYSFANEMRELLEKSTQENNEMTAFEIALMIIEEAVEAFQYADDSGGDIGSLIYESMACLVDMTSAKDDLKAPMREQMFEKLLVKSESDTFNGWDEFRVDLLRICAGFGETQHLRERLHTKLQLWSDRLARKAGDKYFYEQLLQLQFELIRAYGEEKEAEEMVQNHLHVTFFREQAVQQAMAKAEYNRAIQLAISGEQQDKLFPGLVDKWMKYRYEAYKSLGQSEEQRQLAKQLLLGGEFGYYYELLALAEGDKKDVYRELKEELKQSRSWRVQEIFNRMIEVEDDVEEMLGVARNNQAYVEHYAPRLIKVYKDEMISIYKKYILDSAARTSNRKEYKKLAQLIKRYKHYAGKDGSNQIINELTELYNKRPALLDELEKIK